MHNSNTNGADRRKHFRHSVSSKARIETCIEHEGTPSAFQEVVTLSDVSEGGFRFFIKDIDKHFMRQEFYVSFMNEISSGEYNYSRKRKVVVLWLYPSRDGELASVGVMYKPNRFNIPELIESFKATFFHQGNPNG